MRLLGVLRLSRDSEASVSIRKQKEIISAYAKAHDHEIVAWAEDSGVSGDCDPFERPALGPWLDEGKASEYDGIVAMKVDRVSRRVVHFARLNDWLQDRGKVIVCVSDGIDTSTKVGKMVAQILSMFAEFELDTIKERIKGTKKMLRTTDRFDGGKIPFGYQSVAKDPDNPKAGRGLVIDDEAAATVRDMVQRVLDGASVASIRNSLTVPAPIDHARIQRGKPAQGVQWSTRAILAILRSPVLLGHKVHNGRAIRGQDGLPLQVAEPLMTLETWGRLQAALDEAAKPHAYRNPTALLADLAYCGGCGGKLYKQVQRSASGVLEYYRCSTRNNGRKCDAPAARKADELERVFIGSFKKSMGHQERMTRVWVPGEDHSEELAQVTTAIEQVREEWDLGLYTDRAEYLARLKRLTERRKQLEQLPNRPGQWEYQGTGETYGDAWQRMEDQDRRQLLLGSGAVALVDARGLRWSTRQQLP